MAAVPLGLIETSLVEGVVLVWACWELWSVRKSKAAKDAAEVRPKVDQRAKLSHTEDQS